MIDSNILPGIDTVPKKKNRSMFNNNMHFKSKFTLKKMKKKNTKKIIVQVTERSF